MRTCRRVRWGGWVGLLLAASCVGLLGGCDQPNFATDAEVLGILSQPRNDAESQALATRGRTLFVRNSCSNCHAVKPPTHGAPLLTNLYTTRATLRDGSKFDRGRAYLVASILRPQEVVVTGYAQQMSNYRFLPAGDVAALVAYLESLTSPATSRLDEPPSTRGVTTP